VDNDEALPWAAMELPRWGAERSHAMIEGLKPYAEYKESGLPWLDGSQRAGKSDDQSTCFVKFSPRRGSHITAQGRAKRR
jgi:hypothetical protein